VPLRRICSTPENSSNHSNLTSTQLRFRHGLRVRMRIRGFETFPNDLGYTCAQRQANAIRRLGHVLKPHDRPPCAVDLHQECARITRCADPHKTLRMGQRSLGCGLIFKRMVTCHRMEVTSLVKIATRSNAASASFGLCGGS